MEGYQPVASLAPHNEESEGLAGRDSELEECEGGNVKAKAKAKAPSPTKPSRAVSNPFSRAGGEHGQPKKAQYLPLIGIPQASMNIVANVAYMKATQEIVQLRTLVTDGPAICRFLGVVGGLVLFFTSLTQLLWNLLSLKTVWPPLVIYHLLSTLLGFATVLLEARAILCSVGLRKRTREYLKLLSFLWGRGLFYLLGGMFLAMRYPSLADLILAGYYLALGILDLFVGLAARHRLETLRGTLTEDEKLIREKFEHFDQESTGRISASDLAALCTELGSRLSHRELESTVLTLDTNRHGIEYETFLEWWRAR